MTHHCPARLLGRVVAKCKKLFTKRDTVHSSPVRDSITVTTTTTVTEEPTAETVEEEQFCVYYAPITVCVDQIICTGRFDTSALVPLLTNEFNLNLPYRITLTRDELEAGALQTLPAHIPGIGQLLTIDPDIDRHFLALHLAHVLPARPPHLWLWIADTRSPTPEIRFRLPGSNLLVPVPPSWLY